MDFRVMVMWDVADAAVALPGTVSLAGYQVTVTRSNTLANEVWRSAVVTERNVTIPKIEEGEYTVTVREIASDSTVPLTSASAKLELKTPDTPTPTRMYYPIKGLTFAATQL